MWANIFGPGTLYRLWPGPTGLEVNPLAVERGLFARPQFFDGQHFLTDQLAALPELDAVGGHLFLVPTKADAEHQTSVRDQVHSRRNLGGDHRVPLGQQADRRTQTYAIGNGRGRG